MTTNDLDDLKYLLEFLEDEKSKLVIIKPVSYVNVLSNILPWIQASFLIAYHKVKLRRFSIKPR